MPRKHFMSGSAGLVVAALLTAGLTAAPFTLAPGSGVTSNSAAAGQAREFVPGGTEEMPDTYNAPLATVGVNRNGPDAASWPAVTAASRHIADYKRALRQGELAQATDSLVAASRRPITRKLVTDLNTELGVQTPLADTQIAQVAAAKQKAMT